MMEKGFILPDGAYVQAIDAAERRDSDGNVTRPEITAADYPAGTVEVPLKPGADHHWTGAAWEYSAPPYVPAPLTPVQFEYLLALTGFGEVWDGIAAQAKTAGDMATYAALMAERRRSTFLLDVVLSVVAQFRAAAAQIAPEVDLSEAAIRAAWKDAETYGGLGNG